MSMTTGGGPKQVSTLTGKQRKLMKGLGDYLNQYVGEPGSELGISAVSAEEEQILADLKDWYTGLPAQLEELGIEEAAKKLLSGEPAFDIDLEESADLFEKGVTTPSFAAFSKYVIPEISRQYKGVGSRRGRKIVEKSTELSQTLAAELAKFQIGEIAVGRGVKESAMSRMPAGMSMASALLGLMPAAGAGLASAFGSVQGRKVADAKRKLPEYSPWLQNIMSYIGTPMTQMVDFPAQMTGWGDVLASTQAIGQAGQSVAGRFTGGGSAILG